ncbi:MAG: sugar transferase [Lachnospiraceae bacterium]
MVQRKEKYINLAVCIIDTLSLIISFVLGSYIWLEILREEKQFTYENIASNIGVVLASYMLVFFFFNMNRYFLKRSHLEELFNIIKNDVFLALIITGLLYLSKSSTSFSRGAFILTILFNVVICYIFRSILKKYIRKSYASKKSKIMLITTHDRAEDVIRHINNGDEWSVEIKSIAIIDANMQGEKILGVPVVASYEDMLDYAKKEVVDEVFFHISYVTGKSMKKHIEEFEKMGVTVHLNINVLDGFDDFNYNITMLGQYPVVSFATKFYDSEKMIIKRCIDLVGGAVGCFITAVVTIFLGVAIKIESPGPIFFKQKRVGRNGRYFYIYKFRSMYIDAEERKKELMSQNEMKGLMFKMKDDPRITRIGKFIRATSLDELPQFFNVLKGDMSLVGTRPPTVDEFKQYKIYHKRRLSIKPGITGMWQVSGRSDIEDFEEVVRLDLQYIDNWSIALDIKILLKTIIVVFGKVGSR